MRGKVKLVAVGIVCLAFAPRAAAGAWTLPKGDGLIISGTSHNSAELAYDGDGKLRTPVDFEKLDTTIYAEYGLSERWTLVGSSALQDVSYTSSEGPIRYNGFATSKLGVRYGLGSSSSSSWVFAVQPSLVIPAGGEAVPDGDLGLGGFGGELRVLAGRDISIAGRQGFFNAEVAYDLRSEGAPRQITTDMTLGVTVTDNIQLIGQGFYRHTNDSVFENDVVLANESLKLQASVVYKLPKIRLFKKSGESERGEASQEKMRPERDTALQIGYFRGVAGRNIVREDGAFLMLWQRF